MNTTIKSTFMLLGLLATLDVSVAETLDTSSKAKSALCTKNGTGLRVVEGDTLSEIAQRVVTPESQSPRALEQSLYECNPTAFRGGKDELVTGKILYLPLSRERESLTEQDSEKPRLSETVVPKPADAMPETTLQPTRTSSIAPPPAEKTTGKVDTSQASPSSLLLVVLGMTGFLVLLLSTLSLYLYRWSKKPPVAPVEPPVSVPAPSHVAQQSVPEQTLAELKTLIAESMNQVRCDSANNTEKFDNLRNIFGTLSRALDEKDAEIRRLKRGYEAQVFQKFLIRFIRTDLAVNDFMRDAGPQSEALDVIKRLLEDALDECGVEAFSPSVGEDYRQAEGVADNPKKMLSNNVDDRYKIAEVIEPGYRLKTPDGYEIVYPAKVRIFTTQ